MPTSTRGKKNPTPGAKKAKKAEAKAFAVKKSHASAPAKKAPSAIAPPAKVANPYLAPAKKAIPAPLAAVSNDRIPTLPVLSPSMFGAVDPIQLALGNYARHASNLDFLGATRHSPTHDTRRKKFEGEYITSVTVPQKDILGPALTAMVSSPCGINVPQIFKTCAGEVTLDKRKLAGSSIFFWISHKLPGRGSKKHIEPDTMMTYLRTFFGHMRDTHDWRFNLDSDFNFEGGLRPCLDILITKRRKEVGAAFGTGANQAKMKDVASINDLDWSVFDENDPKQHCQKVMVYFGGYLGFRGSGEHVKLERHHIERGTFEVGHPWAGDEYWAIQNMPDKTNKLSSSNTILRKNRSGRIPVKSEPGQCILRFLDKFSPHQERVYCRPATLAQLQDLRRSGRKKSMFSAREPLGVNTICLMMNDACAKLGHPECSGHGFRRLFITTLANDPRVSIAEAMESSRHSSVSAQLTYVERSGVSESGKFAALGFQKTP